MINYNIFNVYQAHELKDVSYAQNNDRLYLCHQNYTPRCLFIKNGVFNFQNIEFGAECVGASNLKHKVLTTANIDPKLLIRKVNYFVLSVDKNGVPMIPALYTPEISLPAKLDTTCYVELTWSAGFDAAEYHIYSYINGIEGYIGKTANLYYLDYGVITPNNAKGLPKNIESFSFAGNCPGKVTFFDQRLIYGGSKNEPNTIWGSKPGQFKAFITESTPTDFCAWKFSIASTQANDIAWLISGNKLFVGTSGEEWRLSGANGSTITPSSVEVRKETSWGSSKLKPLNIGGDILFVDRTGKSIRSFNYSNESNAYIAPNINSFAEHLMREQKVVDWEYLHSDFNIIYLVTDIGNLLGVTYDRDNQVCAWHRYETDGKFLSVAALPSDGGDELIAVIEREINGNKIKYIERLEKTFNNADNNYLNSAYLDSMLSYSGDETDTLYGLTHLKGKTVAILADNNFEATAVVDSNGSIKLSSKVKQAHVGLLYNSEVVTLPLEATLQDGTLQTRTKRITDISVKLEKSLGLEIGTDKNKMIPLNFTDKFATVAKPIKLFTGIKKISNIAGYDTTCNIILRQNNALPSTVIGVYPQVKSISE